MYAFYWPFLHLFVSQGKILIGTKESEIFEIDEKKSTVMNIAQGHGEGELWGLAAHPTKEVFASASDDTTIRIWDAAHKVSVFKA